MTDTMNVEKKSQTDNVQSTGEKLYRRIRMKRSAKSIMNWFLDLFTIITVVRNYSIRKDTIMDVISGLTMGLLHVPQGMAIALVGNLPPYIGIYTSFFAVVPYIMFGSNTHVTLQPSLVSALLLGESIKQDYPLLNDSVGNATIDIISKNEFATQICSTYLFYSGIVYLLMYLLRLGFVVWYVSLALRSGIVFGVLTVAIAAQVKLALGIIFLQKYGPLSFIYNIIETCKSLPETNLACLLFSSLSITAICLVKLFQKRMGSKLKIPIPIELIVLIVSIMVSYFVNVHERYGVPVVGIIPDGFPEPSIPNLEISLDSSLLIIYMSLINLISFISINGLFEKHQVCRFNSNNVIFAMGVSSIISSFFPCMPVTASVFASLIMENTGGKTILSHFFASVTLGVIFSAFVSAIKPLPICILASLLIVAIFPKLTSILTAVKNFWKTDKGNLLIFVVSSGLLILYDIKTSFVTGILLCIVMVFVRFHRTPLSVVDDNKILHVTLRTHHIKVISYDAPLIFVNAEIFLSKFQDECFPNSRAKTIDGENVNSVSFVQVSPSLGDGKEELTIEKNGNQHETNADVTHIILDFGGVSYIDQSGSIALKKIYRQLKDHGVELILASCSKTAFKMMEIYDVQGKDGRPYMYPSVHSAVEALEQRVAVCPRQIDFGTAQSVNGDVYDATHL